MLRTVLTFAAFLGCYSLIAIAQPGTEKKGEITKGKDDSKKAGKDTKGKSIDKDDAKEPAKSKTPIDQMKLPTNVVIVVVEDLLKAGALIPKHWIVPYEEWFSKEERIKALELQLKGDRALPSSCKLSGKLEGDFLEFDAEYIFATGAGKTTVPLGLQGGYLLGHGQLKKQPAILEFDKDDGFVARIDKEGNPHRLTFKFRVPVKKSATGGLDRSIDLGLPQAAGTTLELELPAGVKEIRWNGALEKPVTPGCWLVALDRSKTLNLAWKEPVTLTGNTPVAKVDTQVKVDVDATHVQITTDLFLEDAASKTEEWHLHLPALAKVEAVKSLTPGLTAKLEEKASLAILRVPPTGDRWQVTLSQRLPRPNPGKTLPIGPFPVLAVYSQNKMMQSAAVVSQQGTITVKMPGETSLGQRLLFVKSEKTLQAKAAETEAVFQFTSLPLTEKQFKAPQTLKAPLELDWRFDKNQLRTEVDHVLKLKVDGDAWEVDATTRIKINALFATIGAIDLKLPMPRPRGLGLIGAAAPAVDFPGTLPWPGIWSTLGTPWTTASADEYIVTDETGGVLKLVPQDATGKTRVLWTRGASKELTLDLRNTYRISTLTPHVRLELPRPLGTQERRTKLTIQTDDRMELLQGPEGAAEPVPDRHRFENSWDHAPPFVDVAWRPHVREVVTQSTLDIDLLEHSATVVQTLRIPRSRPGAALDVKGTQIALKVPDGVDKVEILEGGAKISHDFARQRLWVRPTKDAGEFIELKLKYDVAIADKHLKVTPIWTTFGSHEDVKVRVWTPTGVQARLTPDLLQRGIWKSRSIELVRDRDQFPALVLSGYGSNLPLTFTVAPDTATNLAALVADRALIQVRVLEDGSQQYQARYLVRQLNASALEIELPLPAPLFRERPTISIGKHAIEQWTKVDANERMIQVPMHADLITLPAVLEINYTLPGETPERGSSSHTTLRAPIFRSKAVVGQTRWQLTTPSSLIAASLATNIRPDVGWGLQGWLLTPESTNVDGDAWLTQRDGGPAGAGVTFAFTQQPVTQEVVYHFPRHWWLLGCSGTFLVVTLGVFFSPMPRWAVWMVLAAISMSLAALVLMLPAAWPGVAYGLQPGVLLFAVFMGVHWLIQERYRRQLVFLPGFARSKAGSTVTRSAGSKAPRETSTVDAPPGAEGLSSKSSTTTN